MNCDWFRVGNLSVRTTLYEPIYGRNWARADKLQGPMAKYCREAPPNLILTIIFGVE